MIAILIVGMGWEWGVYIRDVIFAVLVEQKIYAAGAPWNVKIEPETQELWDADGDGNPVQVDSGSSYIVLPGTKLILEHSEAILPEINARLKEQQIEIPVFIQKGGIVAGHKGRVF